MPKTTQHICNMFKSTRIPKCLKLFKESLSLSPYTLFSSSQFQITPCFLHPNSKLLCPLLPISNSEVSRSVSTGLQNEGRQSHRATRATSPGWKPREDGP